jgi:triosephosphate isomerase
MKRPVFAANWKMQHGPQDARAYLLRFIELMQPRTDRTMIFFPPALSVAVAGFALRDRPEILVGVQNIHWEDKGAFTGENSAPMAHDAGAKIALVGHSERRILFGEGDEMTAKKCAAAYRAGLTAMLCVGERLEERERNTTQAVVLRQLKAGISRLEPSQIATIAIAYEPVWAIGTGRTATPEDATSVHSAIRRVLKEAIGSKSADVPICYGGSVNEGNVAQLLAAPEVDGVLVGGASLDAETWAKICQT